MKRFFPALILSTALAACSGDPDPGEDTGGTDPSTDQSTDSTPEPTDTAPTDTEPPDTDVEDTDPTDSDTDGAVSGAPMPDFSLEDVSENSARYGEQVSPRDYLEKVSGWYFTHAG